jgi:hypothetical protein
MLIALSVGTEVIGDKTTYGLFRYSSKETAQIRLSINIADVICSLIKLGSFVKICGEFIKP